MSVVFLKTWNIRKKGKREKGKQNKSFIQKKKRVEIGLSLIGDVMGVKDGPPFRYDKLGNHPYWTQLWDGCNPSNINRPSAEEWVYGLLRTEQPKIETGH